MKEKDNTVQEITETNQHPSHQEDIVKLIKGPLTPKMKQQNLLSYHEKDISDALCLLSVDDRKHLYTLLDAEWIAEILEYSDDSTIYLNEIPIQKRMAVLSHFETVEMLDYIREMDKDSRDIILDLLDSEKKREFLLLNSFNEDEIGSKMTSNYVVIDFGISVKEAMSSLIRQANDNDNISTIYVLDKNQIFLGAIDLKDLIIAREGTDLEKIITTSYPYVYATEQIDDCLSRIKDYSEDSIPVLDNENKLIGVLTSQTIMELVDDEMSEDYAKFAGLSSEEDLNEPLRKSIMKRLPWLMVLLVLGMFVSSIVGVFEKVVAQLPLIIAFQSLILDMAGNVGTQSLAVTIRVLIDENIGKKQKFFLVCKETRIGLVNGMILGVLSFVMVGFYLVLLKSQTMNMAFSISACTGIALLVSMILSSMSGTLIPLMFIKMKIDPAVASGPLITTINDLVAVITYYCLVWVLIIGVI
ncbi:magnesium transporter [Filifactor alocis]|uniref:magnesium transporter n=1 Tax=Filifactor alocis TaxID=143361 RepID=UPI0028D153C7|nr:magnesium transporter [Filifactor alocis]